MRRSVISSTRRSSSCDEGIHVLVVDLFPPTPRDPQGIHGVIWDEIGDETFDFPPGKDRTLVSYESGDDRVAYIEPLAVGDVLRDMPLFLSRGLHVPVPLESTYLATWDATPEVFRARRGNGRSPGTRRGLRPIRRSPTDVRVRICHAAHDTSFVG